MQSPSFLKMSKSARARDVRRMRKENDFASVANAVRVAMVASGSEKAADGMDIEVAPATAA